MACGQAIFLSRAARLVRHGHLDEAGIQRRLQIGLAKVIVVFQPQRLLKLLACHLAHQHLHEPHFRGDFRGRRIGRPLQHLHDLDTGIAGEVGPAPQAGASAKFMPPHL